VPQLDPTWFASQLFWLAVSFSLLYFVLAKVILPPLLAVMGQRKGKIEENLAVAQDFKKEAEEAKNSYEKVLASSKAKALEIVAAAEAESKEKAAQATKALDIQVAAQLANASKNIAEKKQEVLAALKPKLAEFSSLIAEKITAHAPSEELVQRAVRTIN